MIELIESCVKSLEQIEVSGLQNHYLIIECMSYLAEMKDLVESNQNGREACSHGSDSVDTE